MKWQISTATRVLAEIITSDVSLLVTFNHAIDGVIQNNPKPRANPKALANWTDTRGHWLALFQGSGTEKVSKVESLQEIIAGMTDSAATEANTSPDCLLPQH